MTNAHQEFQAIFEAARSIESPIQREEFLQEQCGTNRELRQQVHALLHAYEESDSFLEHPPQELQATIDEPTIERPGTQIGPYKLREQIGEGGFGVVYVAEQTQPVRRKVALKIIKPGMDTKEVVARFEAERQALAIMDHPNLAKVLDAGATDSGRPYFVMELVHGMPITDFCDEQNLTMLERLKLFVDVCRAIQHAHQKGIIHRDVKPSNVMVTLHDDQPVVKVIDFGVAKALSRELSEMTLFTAYGQMLGTPLYMSPEQAQLSGLDVDTRSDVYSLGVVLYEVLTGTTPFDKETLQNAGFDEFRRIIREDEPPRPSARISTLKAEVLSTVSGKRQIDPRKLSRSYRGELDWIVMRALEKDRTRRYESASALAADVERFINDEPVQACPPSVWYRFRKFARRRKRALTVSFVMGVAVVLSFGSLGWMIRDRGVRKQEAEHEQAVRQTQVIMQVDLHLDEVHRLMKERKWPEALVAANRANAALASGDADAKTRKRVERVLADLKLVHELERAWLLQHTDLKGETDFSGNARAIAQIFNEAGPTVEDVPVQQAAAALRARPAIVSELAASLLRWAELQRIVQEENGTRWKHLLAVADAIDPDPWCRRLRAAWRTVTPTKTFVELARTTDVRNVSPTSIVLLSSSLRKHGQRREALELLLRAHQQQPDDFLLNFQLGFVMTHSVRRYHAATIPTTFARRIESLGFYRTALALRPRSSFVLNNMGIVLRQIGHHDEAMACYRQALEINAQNVKAHINLGYLLENDGKLDEAIDHYKRAIANAPDYADAHLMLGKVLWRKGDRFAEAAVAFRNVVRLRPKDAQAHTLLGQALLQSGEHEAAVAPLRESIQLLPDRWSARVVGELNQIQSPRTHAALGLALLRSGRPKEAIAPLERALRRAPHSSWARFGLAAALAATEYRDRAAKVYAEQLKRVGYSLGDEIGSGEWTIVARDEELFIVITKNMPNDYRPWAARGAAFGVFKQWDRAADDYNRALDLVTPKPNRWWGPQATLSIHAARWPQVHERLQNRRPDDSRLWIGLSRHHAANRRWPQAARALQKVIDADKGGDHFAWYLMATLKLQMGDVKGYRRVCDVMLDRWPRARYKPLLARTVIVSLLHPDVMQDRHAEIIAMADDALTAAKSAENEGSWDSWAYLARGLAAYRAGDLTRARTWLNQAYPRSRRRGKKIDQYSMRSARFILAMIFRREGSRSFMMYNAELQQFKRLKDPGRNPQRFQDWLICDLLRREAEQVMKQPPGKRKPRTTRRSKPPVVARKPRTRKQRNQKQP